MKVVILCGGLGTRLREETEFRPKPMVPIGAQPILWHIMKIYAHYGHTDFILCLGYKGLMIKEYFRNYQWATSDVTIQLGEQSNLRYHSSHQEEKWSVTLVDTGATTMTGGRLKCVLPFIEEETFLLTYGDGLTDSNINATIESHLSSKAVVTLTAVQPESRFGELCLDGNTVTAFSEKPDQSDSFINGGFFVVNKSIEEYLTENDHMLERQPLKRLASEGKVNAYKHTGFWQCMDTYREQQILTSLWESNKAPWKVW